MTPGDVWSCWRGSTTWASACLNRSIGGSGAGSTYKVVRIGVRVAAVSELMVSGIEPAADVYWDAMGWIIEA